MHFILSLLSSHQMFHLESYTLLILAAIVASDSSTGGPVTSVKSRMTSSMSRGTSTDLLEYLDGTPPEYCLQDPTEFIVPLTKVSAMAM